MFDFEALIARYGWALQIVEPGPGPGWVYTVGLTDFDHPELVTVGAAGDAGPALNGLGERVRQGERFSVRDSTEVHGAGVVLGAVHPAQIEQSLVDTWFAHYEVPGQPTPELRVLQVSFTGCECRICRLRLDTPTWVLDDSTPDLSRVRSNRAFRRAGARDRPRRPRRSGIPGYRPREP